MSSIYVDYRGWREAEKHSKCHFIEQTIFDYIMYNMYALESIQSNDFLYYDFKHYQITEQTFFCAVYFSHPVSFVLYVYSPESMHYNQAIFD